METAAAIEEIRTFTRFYTNTIGVVDRHILGTAFSLTEARILLEIHHRERCHARSIKQVLNVDEGYLSRTIDKLTRQGLIRKRRARGDGRVVELSLSPRGRRSFMDLKRRMEDAIEDLIQPLSDTEVEELVAHMQRVRMLLYPEGGAL